MKVYKNTTVIICVILAAVLLFQTLVTPVGDVAHMPSDTAGDGPGSDTATLGLTRQRVAGPTQPQSIGPLHQGRHGRHESAR